MSLQTTAESSCW